MIDALIGNDYSLCLSDALNKADADITLIIPANKTLSRKPEFKVLKILPSKNPEDSKIIKIKDYMLYVRSMLKLILGNNILIHYQFFRSKIELLFLWIFKMAGAHIVYTAHNVLPHESSKIDPWIFRSIYHTVDEIIVHSDFIKKKLLNQFTINKAKVHVIPHGDFNMFLPVLEKTGISARKRFAYAPEDKVLLFFGYIREYKGLDLLLDAFGTLQNHDNRFKLLIAGSPATEALLREYSERIQATPGTQNIHAVLDFIPHENVADYFLTSDLVVLPYRKIDHSGIVHLACSFGKPVLATKVGDFEEVILPQKTGFLIEENTIKSLAEGIHNAFSDSFNLKEMGKAAKTYSDTHFSWNRIALKTIEVYQQTQETVL